MKADPEDLRKLADDLDKAVHEHQDAIRHNPDIHSHIRSAKEKAISRYHEVHTTGYDKNGDVIQ